MSTEEGSFQPPPAAGDKARATKPTVTTTSAFINKGGKTFAPKGKVVRRRPGAGTAASTPKPSESAASTPAPQSSQTQTPAPPDIPQPVEQQTTSQLPTLALTQQALEEEQLAPSASTNVTDSSAVPALTELSSTSAPTNKESASQERVTENVPTPTIDRVPTPRPAEEDLDSGRPAKRQRDDPPEDTGHALEVEVAQGAPTPTPEDPIQTSLPEQPSLPSSAQAAVPASEVIESDVPRTTETETETPFAPVEAPVATIQRGEQSEEQVSEAPVPTTRSTRQGPWTAVNVSENGVESVASTEVRGTRPKRRRGPITLREIDEEEQGEGGEEEEASIAPKRPSTKARGKRNAGDTAASQDAEGTQPPRRKPRKPRKDKGKGRAVEEAEGVIENGEPGEQEPGPPKRRRKKKQSTEQPEGEQQLQRKGRQAREDTPSDAESHTIDPGATFMNSLASRNIRMGKLSQREKKMREINWDEVKQRRREREEREMNDPKRVREEADERLREAAEAQNAAIQDDSQVQTQLVDGQIQFVHKPIDRHGDAERAIEQMDVVEEDDFTNLVNSKTFLRSTKRFPQDFMTPGQGKRWNFKDTEHFYDALEMFGTDFQMIATLFPGVTRRSVKLKFTREERRNPDEVKRRLHGRKNMDWDQYLASSGRKDDSFADPDVVKKELEAERARMEIEIEAAKAAAEEERRQRRLAGVESEEEAGDKENENEKERKKKERKNAQKAVSFEQEEGLEILGDIDEDEGWGVE